MTKGRLFITPNDTMGASDSISIQNAVDLAAESGINKVVIPRQNLRTGTAKWLIDTPILLPSHMTVVLENCLMQMADDVVGGFFYSANMFKEEAADPKKRMYDIHITGVGNAVLDGGNATELNEETHKRIGVYVRRNTSVIFMNVEHFSVSGIKIVHHRYWGMCFQYCARGTIKDIFFDVCRDRRNQDGVNLRNGCHDILIENISGQTGDDMVALSAIDYGAENTFNAYRTVDGADPDIYDVTVRNISGAAIGHPLVALRNHNGAKMYNVLIENIRDTAQTQPAYDWNNGERYALVHIGQNAYYVTPQVMGDTHNITVRDLFCSYSTAALLLGATVRDITVENVQAWGKAKKIITTIGDNWGDDIYGVKIDGLTLSSSSLRCEGEGDAAIDFSFMMEGDYIKDMTLSAVSLKNVPCLLKVHKRSTENDIQFANCRLGGADEEPVVVEPFEHKRADRAPLYFRPTLHRTV